MRWGWTALMVILWLAPALGWGEADGIREIKAALAVVEPGPEAPLQAAAEQGKIEEQEPDNQEGQEGAEE